MIFQWQQALWLLLLVPVLILLYMIAQRRRAKYALRYASLSLVKEALGRGPGFRRHIPPILFLTAITVMILALARPISVVTLPTQEGTVILTVDVSGSMAADDAKPNRMEAAKAAARTFVEKQPVSVKVGIVSFSDNAFVVQAPTTDKDAVIAAISRLQPQRGTAIGRGILASLDAIAESLEPDEPDFTRPTNRGFSPIMTPTPTPTPLPKGQYVTAIVVLLSDGESNVGPNPRDVAPVAADRGVRVYTIGLGKSQGTILHVQGRQVRVSLDEAVLKYIADQTDAEYFAAADEKELQAVYDKLTTRMVFRAEKTEITAVLTAIAAAFSLLAGFLSLVWFNRLP
ncbi:MAG: VWA domain-containing protein [Chloroflexi bacterium]|nr:VWA domain-containing protein [Chloroflexota bacterium]